MQYDRAYHLNLQEFNRFKRRYQLAWAEGRGPTFLNYLYARMVRIKDEALPSVRLPKILHSKMDDSPLSSHSTKPNKRKDF